MDLSSFRDRVTKNLAGRGGSVKAEVITPAMIDDKPFALFVTPAKAGVQCDPGFRLSPE
jgi:hypothetical protein